VLHTHCAENRDEVALVQQETGLRNVHYLERCGVTGERSVFAHMVHLDASELAVVARTRTAIAHCPSSNCKLASGIAPIPDYLAAGIRVSLGADGAPCNNTMDIFQEMRLAALLHKPRSGARAMDAATVLRMATLGGAEALGLSHLIGTIAVGKRADLVHLRLNRPFNGVAGSVMGQIVYTGSRENVIDVWCDGAPLVRNGALTTLDEAEVMARGREAAHQVVGRI
jgi:cytosine/adenosine deaminase-related metal-dependent hydrolase